MIKGLWVQSPLGAIFGKFYFALLCVKICQIIWQKRVSWKTQLFLMIPCNWIVSDLVKSLPTMALLIKMFSSDRLCPIELIEQIQWIGPVERAELIRLICSGKTYLFDNQKVTRSIRTRLLLFMMCFCFSGDFVNVEIFVEKLQHQQNKRSCNSEHGCKVDQLYQLSSL